MKDSEAPASAGASAVSGAAERDPAPEWLLHLRIRPHRSMGPVGFAWVLLITWIGFLIPMLAFLGTAVLWGLLPFTLAALAALWWFMRRNFADAALREELWLSHELIRVERHEPDGRVRDWQANPFWVRAQIRPDGPVEDYLTLSGAGREIELGAFLSPGERRALHARLERALARARQPAPVHG